METKTKLYEKMVSTIDDEEDKDEYTKRQCTECKEMFSSKQLTRVQLGTTDAYLCSGCCDTLTDFRVLRGE